MPKKSTSRYIQTRDPKGELHAQAARISKALDGGSDISAAVRHALSMTDQYYRRVSKPIDYRSAETSLLRDYAVHGYDFAIRAAALAEIERRYSAGEVTK